jgi:hypothetical protein
MPGRPQGQKRSADVIGAAIMMAKIVTGEITEFPEKKSGRVRNGRAGAKARAKKLSKGQQSEIARVAALARWEK